MAVHAHPDDESSKGAATSAKYAAEGDEVLVVTLTGGERGSILNPAMDIPGVADRIVQVRRDEMAEAAKILGVRQHWLGFVDSGLPKPDKPGDPLPPLPPGCFALVPPAESTEALVRVVREFRPHVMITYGEDGDYPHPDHVMCHRISLAAFESAGESDRFPEAGAPWTPLKLYYTHGFIPQRLTVLAEEYERLGQPFPMAGWLDRMREHIAARGDFMIKVTTQVECAKYFPQRDDALRAHATQVDPDGVFFKVPLEMQQRLWPTEEFELARTRVRTDLPETDLFAGVREAEVAADFTEVEEAP